MSLLNTIIGSLVGGSASQVGTSPLVTALQSLLAGRTGGRGGVSGSPGSGTGGFDGLGTLVEQFTRSGYGGAINSWSGAGQNQPIHPNQLGEALGADTVNQLSRQTGLSGQDLLSQLARMLPSLVDQLTPQGRLPSGQERARW